MKLREKQLGDIKEFHRVKSSELQELHALVYTVYLLNSSFVFSLYLLN